MRRGLRQDRHVFGRTREFFAQQYFAEPVASQDGAGARSAALLGKRGGEGQDAAPTLGTDAVNTLPALAGHLETVMAGQRAVHEDMVGIDEREHGAVLLEEVGEEALGFFLHITAQGDERREVSLTLLVERGDVAHVQPLAAELTGQPLRLGILDHATHLRREYLRFMQFT